MCGLAVAIGWDDAEAAVRRLIDGLVHRGDITDPLVSPSPGAAMCTRRLRIVDGERAIQPQLSCDGRVLVAFNGEIYNHAQLRRELETLGAVFKTSGDTEVLATALSLWGAGALQRLNGMYAFVALNLDTGDFLAARDPAGVKPLYLIQSGTGFLFCSEIRPLLAAVETGDVLLIPPGHLFTGVRLLQFRSLAAEAQGPAHAHDPRTLDRLLAAAVQIRLPPDLPAALMFSGGIDSTLIAHYARQVRPETPGYFLGGAGAPDYPYAALYAGRSGLDLRHVEVDLGDEDAPAWISRIVGLAETFNNHTIRDSLCTWLLCRRIREDGYRVVLSGEGADELFAGYGPLEQAFAQDEAAGTLVRDQYLGNMHRTNLQRLDRCSMQFQLEAREPFLDPTVIAYALGLGGTALAPLVDGRPRGKAPLRSLYRLYPDQLPARIAGRSKAPVAEGAGFEAGDDASPWIDFAEQAVTDRGFADGQRRFAPFGVQTKEELLYLEVLASTLDVWRVPHLTAERRLLVPEGVANAGTAPWQARDG